MRNIELNNYVDTDLDVTGRHFGGNVLYTRNTDNGNPDPNFVDAVDNLDVQYIRYPAGQPDVAYADGVIVDGYLPNHLVNFLESARANNWQVLIVTPTHESYPGAEAIGDFAHLLARDFGDVVHAIEVGNEYWNHQTETSYGQVANDSVLEIAEALDDAGVDIPIWVQMGDAAGLQSEFHASNDDRGWLTRTIDANNTIIDQISAEAFAEIDGVVEHFYLRGEGEQFIDIESPNDQMISLDFAIWQDYVEDATLNITEWNIRTSNLDQLGIRAASSLVAHFSHIIELGADEAYLWPPHLNTSTDLAGSGEVITDADTGIVINSVGGAIFDMMSTSLPGLEYLPSGALGAGQHVIHHLYGSDNRVVVYLSSRTNDVENVSYSLGEYFEGFTLTSALRVGYDHSTSDGRHFNYRTRAWEQSDVITVRGEDYVINEHDVQATIDVLDVAAVHPFDDYVFELLPYQVVELVYELPDYNIIEGTEVEDTLSGTDADDWILLQGGDDSVTAGGGSDTISGGLGDDAIFGGADDDDIQGAYGRDSLFGGEGNDSLFGGEGNDFLSGENGNDLLIAGEGQDSIDGGSGRDTLSFGDANDGVTVWSAEQVVEVGADLVEFSAVEVIETTEFADRLTLRVNDMEFIGLGGDDHFDLLGGQDNTLYGGAGDDTMFVYAGTYNAVFGGAGNDRIVARGNGNEFSGGMGDDEIQFFNRGADTVRYREGDGNDTIRGFDIGQDRLHLDRELELHMSIQQQNGGSTILFDNGGSIEFQGLNDLTFIDISFV